MRKFKLNCIGEQCSAPIKNSKDKMLLIHRTDNMVVVRRVSNHPKNGQSVEMEWDVFTKDEIKSLYHLITRQV
jgi:hypothetical protein